MSEFIYFDIAIEIGLALHFLTEAVNGFLGDIVVDNHAVAQDVIAGTTALRAAEVVDAVIKSCHIVACLLVNTLSCSAVDVTLADGVEWTCVAVFVVAVVTVIAGTGEVLAVLAGCVDAGEECGFVHNSVDVLGVKNAIEGGVFSPPVPPVSRW